MRSTPNISAFAGVETARDAAMKIEEDASEFGGEVIDELGKVADEANL